MDGTSGAVQQVRGRLDELSSEHACTTESVQQLRTDVDKMQTEVGGDLVEHFVCIVRPYLPSVL